MASLMQSDLHIMWLMVPVPDLGYDVMINNDVTDGTCTWFTYKVMMEWVVPIPDLLMMSWFTMMQLMVPVPDLLMMSWSAMM